jgi:hypothetical protein
VKSPVYEKTLRVNNQLVSLTIEVIDSESTVLDILQLASCISQVLRMRGRSHHINYHDGEGVASMQHQQAREGWNALILVTCGHSHLLPCLLVRVQRVCEDAGMVGTLDRDNNAVDVPDGWVREDTTSFC